MHFITIAAKRGSTPSIGDGSSITTLTASSVIVLALNGNRPVTASYRITPSAQMSLRASTSRAERRCSGDM